MRPLTITAVSERRGSYTVAYVPFATFLSAIENLERGSMLHRIDSSIWRTYSTAIRSQLLNSFRFLGLTDESDRPTPMLRRFVQERANRKVVLREILKASYARIIGMDLTRISPKQLDDAMLEYGMRGETHKKVVSFFLRAAKYAEMPMSPLLGKKTRVSATRKRKRASDESTGAPAIEASVPYVPRVLSKTIRLTGGGTMTVALSCNFLEMDARDRQFVSTVIDKIQEYEKQPK